MVFTGNMIYGMMFSLNDFLRYTFDTPDTRLDTPPSTIVSHNPIRYSLNIIPKYLVYSHIYLNYFLNIFVYVICVWLVCDVMSIDLGSAAVCEQCLVE